MSASEAIGLILGGFVIASLIGLVTGCGLILLGELIRKGWSVYQRKP